MCVDGWVERELFWAMCGSNVNPMWYEYRREKLQVYEFENFGCTGLSRYPTYFQFIIYMCLLEDNGAFGTFYRPISCPLIISQI